MKKYFIFALIAVSLFVWFGLEFNTEARRNPIVFVSPTPTPKTLAKLEKVELDRNEIFVPCPPGMSRKPGAVCDDVSSIKVKTSVVNLQNDELTFNYTISGGRIVGSGASVSWDLSGVRPGTYTITVGISDGSEIYAATQTKTVQVKVCDCRYVDACPAIEISASTASVKAGETVTFTANVSGEPDSDITYNWTVSTGTIIEGQGTSEIKVETTRDMADANLTASVSISSASIASICETSASKTVSITK